MLDVHIRSNGIGKTNYHWHIQISNSFISTLLELETMPTFEEKLKILHYPQAKL